ncbi:C40 family peptidase [Frigidibacter oleivorans]|uniref:C40 family peptidase n=1 Tax=Frigidibacter oleivorans TaxID=2487129 RepID=UPI000F8F3F19|nr:NlpC/P60 family protein [Frigidibacter oleivorans]
MTRPSPVWSDAWLGLPYADLGRSRAGADCWGLARLVYADECGIPLPSYDEAYADPAEAREIERALSDREPWSDWRQVEQPQPFDLALFTRGGWRSHVGIIVTGRLMLHMPRTGSCIAHLDRSRWGQRLAGIYRHRQMEDRP